MEAAGEQHPAVIPLTSWPWSAWPQTRCPCALQQQECEIERQRSVELACIGFGSSADSGVAAVAGAAGHAGHMLKLCCAFRRPYHILNMHERPKMECTWQQGTMQLLRSPAHLQACPAAGSPPPAPPAPPAAPAPHHTPPTCPVLGAPASAAIVVREWDLKMQSSLPIKWQQWQCGCEHPTAPAPAAAVPARHLSAVYHPPKAARRQPTQHCHHTTHHHVLPIDLWCRQPQLHPCVLLGLRGRVDKPSGACEHGRLPARVPSRLPTLASLPSPQLTLTAANRAS